MPLATAQDSSPALLRLTLRPSADGLSVDQIRTAYNFGDLSDPTFTNTGSAWGYDTETSAGNTVPTQDSLNRFLTPAERTVAPALYSTLQTTSRAVADGAPAAGVFESYRGVAAVSGWPVVRGGGRACSDPGWERHQ